MANRAVVIPSYDQLMNPTLAALHGLADDLRELRGARVRFHYSAGTEVAPKRRTGEVELTYDEVRKGVRSYWESGVQQGYHRYVQRLDGSG
jgi:hypothetical protein